MPNIVISEMRFRAAQNLIREMWPQRHESQSIRRSLRRLIDYAKRARDHA